MIFSAKFRLTFCRLDLLLYLCGTKSYKHVGNDYKILNTEQKRQFSYIYSSNLRQGQRSGLEMQDGAFY